MIHTDAVAVAAQRYAPRVRLTTLQDHPQNPRRGQDPAVAESIDANGFYGAIVAQLSTKHILAGHTRRRALQARGETTAPVIWLDVDDATALRILLADNRTAELAAWDDAALIAILGDMPTLDGTGFNADDLARITRELSGDADGDPGPEDRPSLADRFLIPPFTVLDARAGWWRDRKRAWLDIGLLSEAGRDKQLAYTALSGSTPDYYDRKAAVERRLGRALTNAEFESDYLEHRGRAGEVAGTSVFDPVLCEIVYRWFCPRDGIVLDPWAGGSVRGLVATLLGLSYTGIELRAEQCTANAAQAATVLTDPHLRSPRWIEGDCLDVLPTLGQADLIFGCPPYYDLERYGDDPRDLSAMDTAGFETAYRKMIALAADQLAPNRYAVLVVGSARDRRGLLRDMRALTVDAARSAGLGLLNDAVLITMVGSLAIRSGRSFTGTRVLGRAHQDVLVFVKGDRKRATLDCGDVDVTDALAGLDAGMQTAPAA